MHTMHGDNTSAITINRGILAAGIEHVPVILHRCSNDTGGRLPARAGECTGFGLRYKAPLSGRTRQAARMNVPPRSSRGEDHPVNQGHGKRLRMTAETPCRSCPARESALSCIERRNTPDRPLPLRDAVMLGVKPACARVTALLLLTDRGVAPAAPGGNHEGPGDPPLDLTLAAGAQCIRQGTGRPPAVLRRQTRTPTCP